MKVQVIDEHFGLKEIHPSTKEWIILNIFRGSVYLFNRKKQGWSGELPFYLSKCHIHGYYITYKQGFHESLYCPKCTEDFFANEQNVGKKLALQR